MLSRLTDDYPHIKTCIFIINKKFEGKKSFKNLKGIVSRTLTLYAKL